MVISLYETTIRTITTKTDSDITDKLHNKLDKTPRKCLNLNPRVFNYWTLTIYYQPQYFL